MYSQKDEEGYILRAFEGKVGRFLDIGAYDGYHYSNTMALVEKGWEGVMVEPGLEAFQQLLERHGGNEKLKLIHAAVGVGNGLTKFWNNPRTFSTTEESNRDRFICEGFGHPFYITMLPITLLLDLFGPFDFISIDTEGTSRFLFEMAVSLQKNRPKLICVEHDGREEECQRWATVHGYSQLMGNEENLIFQRGA